MEIFYTMIMTVSTRLYTFVMMLWIVDLKSVNFIIYTLYFNNVSLRKRKIWATDDISQVSFKNYMFTFLFKRKILNRTKRYKMKN